MVPFLLLIQAELRKSFYTLKSYQIQIIADQLFLGITFLMVTGVFELVTAGQYSPAEQLSSLAGFLIWRVAAGLMADVTNSIALDAQWGTLEQVYLGRNNLERILTARAVAAVCYYSIRVAVMATILIAVLRIPFRFVPGSLIIYLLTFIGMFGLMLTLTGLHLVFKNISAILFALGTILLFLTGAMSTLEGVPILFPLSRLLPLSSGIDLYRVMVVDGESLAAVVSSREFLWFGLNTVFYLGSGILMLKWARRRVFLDGSLAHY